MVVHFYVVQYGGEVFDVLRGFAGGGVELVHVLADEADFVVGHAGAGYGRPGEGACVDPGCGGGGHLGWCVVGLGFCACAGEVPEYGGVVAGAVDPYGDPVAVSC